MIVGVGVDVCDVERFAASLRRTPQLAERLMTPGELSTPEGGPRPPDSLAGRFAAKEALAKALGAPPGLGWHDAEVVSDASGRPRFELRGTVAAAAVTFGAERVHLSISHDAGVATAFVVLEA